MDLVLSSFESGEQGGWVLSASQSQPTSTGTRGRGGRGRGRGAASPRGTPPVRTARPRSGRRSSSGASPGEREVNKRMLVALKSYPDLWMGVKTGWRSSITEQWQDVAMATTGNPGDGNMLKFQLTKIKGQMNYRIDQAWKCKLTVPKSEWRALRHGALEKFYYYHPFEYWTDWTEAEYLTKFLIHKRIGVDLDGEFGGDNLNLAGGEGEELNGYPQDGQYFGDGGYQVPVGIGAGSYQVQAPVGFVGGGQAQVQDHLYGYSGNGDGLELELGGNFDFRLQGVKLEDEVPEPSEPIVGRPPVEDLKALGGLGAIKQDYDDVEVEDPSRISAPEMHIFKEELDSEDSLEAEGNSQQQDTIGEEGGVVVAVKGGGAESEEGVGARAEVEGVAGSEMEGVAGAEEGDEGGVVAGAEERGVTIAVKKDVTFYENPLTFLLPKIGVVGSEAVEDPERPPASNFGITEEEMEKRVENFKTFQKHLKEKTANLEGDQKKTEYFQKISHAMVRVGTFLETGKSVDDVIQWFTDNPL